MKKIISAALAAMLAVSAVSTAAFAEDTTLISEGVVARPAIKVTMPKSMSFVFNPYKLKVDAKGKIGAEIKDGSTVLNDGYVVPSYVFDETTKTIGWVITNNTGAPIKAGIVANSKNLDDGSTDGLFAVIDDSAALATGRPAKVRALKVKVEAAPIKADGTYDTAKLVYVNTTAITADADKSILEKCVAEPTAVNTKGTLVTGIPSTITKGTETIPGTLSIKMSGTIQNDGALAWQETDIPKIDFIYAFDLDGGSTAS